MTADSDPARTIVKREATRGRTAAAGGPIACTSHGLRSIIAAGMRTQVGIVGAGPAGLVLSHLLHLEGIASIVLERRSREYVEKRVRAGVLEQSTVDLLTATGVGDRLKREGIVHHGIELRFQGEPHRIPLTELSNGRSIWIYGQQEVVKDLVNTRLAAGAAIHYEVEDVSIHDIDSQRPRIRCTIDGTRVDVECDFIAGC